MKGFKTAFAVVVIALGALTGCNDYNNSIQGNTGPPIISLAPSGTVAGSSDFTLTVQGSASSAYQTNSVIQWNGTKLPTTFVDALTLTAKIPASFVAKEVAVFVTVLTPQTGTGNNGLSNAYTFTVYGTTPNPVPTITSINPTSAPACGTSCSNTSVSITVTGTNFLPTSTNGGASFLFADQLTPMQQPTAMKITNLSSTQITATVPGIYLANNDTGTIMVSNPPNLPPHGVCTDANCARIIGGGPSNALTFTIGTGAPQSATEETPAVSQDGRYVVYAAQQNQLNQIFLKDTCVGAPNGCTESSKLVSAADDSTAGNADSHNASITSDGRYIAFSSAATNLVEGAPTGRQIYVRDTCVGASNSCKPATTLISIDSDGSLNGTESILPSISTNGRYIAFVAVTPSHTNTSSSAAAKTQAASQPNSGLRQVFVRDTCLGAANCTPKTTRISMAPGDAPTNTTQPAGPAISGQAKQIALSDGKTSTVFTPTVPVSDQVFLAVPKNQ